jgi:hypothetical protein
MVQFTYAEYASMHFMYNFCGGSTRTALTEYHHQYPEQRLTGVFALVQSEGNRCIHATSIIWPWQM